MKYPVTEALLAAIDGLFENRDTALILLGVSNAAGIDLIREESLSPNIDSVERARLFRKKLEMYLEQMAAEKEEYSDVVETTRLRTEAVGILIALRELCAHFPEAFSE